MYPLGPRLDVRHRMTTTLPFTLAHLHCTRARRSPRSNTKSYRKGETGRDTPTPSSIAAAAIFDSAIAPF
jgi:hypothetical protein